MRRNIHPAVLVFILLPMLFHCGGGGSVGKDQPSSPPNPALGTPQLLSFAPSELDITKVLNLVGKLQILPAEDLNGLPVKEMELAVSYVPKDPDRVNSPKMIQVIPDGGVHVENLQVGSYLFQIHLSHRSATQGDIKVASIEQAVTILDGQDVSVDFAGSTWRYDFDDDGDGYSNVTELMNGRFEEKIDSVGGKTTIWVPEPTDPKNPQSHPGGVAIIDPKRIGSTSPDSNGNAKIIGDPLSVQSGVMVTIIHKAADGTEKERISVFSRLDGSFEATLSNSVQGDTVQIYTTSLPSLDGNPAYSSLSVSDPNLASVSLLIHYLPVKVKNCFATNPRNAVPGVGFVAIQGEGFGSSEAENEVIFPSQDGLGVKANELFITSQTATFTEITVKIPLGAVSGFPIVHNSLPVNNSYGKCDTQNDVVILQDASSGNGPPDLFADLLEVPWVAVIGDEISVKLHVVNQGFTDAISIFPFKTYLSFDDAPSVSTADKEIFPESTNLSQPGPNSLDLEKILGLKSGDISRPNLNFTLTRVDSSFAGSSFSFKGSGIRFKVYVDPKTSISTRGLIVEGNENNNLIVSPTSPNSTYFHFMDLEFRDINGNSIGGAGTDHPVLFDVTTYPNANAISKVDPLVLKHNFAHIQVGKIQNKGSYPLKRVTAGGVVDFVNNDPADSNDPLDTTKNLYKEAKRLAGQIEQVNQEEDLVELDMQKLLQQADAMNQVQMPVKVHVVYSKDDQLGNKDESGNTDDQPVVCQGCEFCVNRLERGEIVDNLKNLSFYRPKSGGTPKYDDPSADANKIDLDLYLDTGDIGLGDGSLFIVTEALKVDPAHVPLNGEANYCQSPEATSGPTVGRDQLHVKNEGDNTPKTILDYSNVDNVIKIPIKATVPDLVIDNVTNLLGGGTIVLGKSVQMSVRINNLQGTADTAVGPQVGFSFANSSVLLGGGIGFGVLPAGGISITQTATISVPANPSDLTQLEAVPFGVSTLVATVDPGSPDQIYEANTAGTGESNNTKNFSVNVVAPDLKIFAVGLGSAGSCDSSTGNCTLNTSLGTNLNIDVYVVNEGTATADAGYPVRVFTSNNCLSSNAVTPPTGPALQAGKAVKVSVPVTVLGTGTCHSTFSINADVNQNHVVIEHVNDSNPAGVSRGWANNSSVPKRYAISDPGSAAFDPATQAGNFVNQTAQGGSMTFNTFIGQSDLGISNIRVYDAGTTTEVVGELVTGRPYDIGFDVTNHGDGSLPAGVSVAAFVKVVGAATEIPLIFAGSGGAVLPTIGAGQSLTNFKLRFKIPPTQSGVILDESVQYKVKVHLNPGDDPDEPSPDSHPNFASSVSNYDLKHVDLTASTPSLNYPDVCSGGVDCGFGVAGDVIQVGFSIQNNTGGTGTALNVPAQVRLLDGSNNLVTSANLPSPIASIAPGGSAPASVNLTVPGGQFRSNYKIKVVADPGDTIGESDETNNLSGASATFDVHIRPTADAGSDFTVTRVDDPAIPGTDLRANIPLNGICSDSEVGSGTPPVAFSGLQWVLNSGTSNCTMGSVTPASPHASSPVNVTVTCSGEGNAGDISFKLICTSSVGLSMEDTILVHVN